VQAGHPEGGHSLWVLSPDSSRNAAILAYWRARTYVEQGRPQLALPLLDQVLAGRKASNIYFLAAQVYEAAGEKQKAVDACTQAVLLPSNRHLEQMNKLRELWVSGGFGSEQQLQQKLRQAKDERFREKHYVANLVDRPMPKFAFVTLKGRKLKSSDIGEKTVVLDVWATSCVPCLPELPQLQELQERHPDVLVLAIAVDSEPGVISRIVQKQRLQTLQIGVGNEHVRDVLAPQGLPSTYVIERGRIRVTHLGALDDVVAYLEADLAALAHKN
ncbi:MAG: redoxin domain-containing protein, partial [Chlamydiota bacterium]